MVKSSDWAVVVICGKSIVSYSWAISCRRESIPDTPAVFMNEFDGKVGAAN